MDKIPPFKILYFITSLNIGGAEELLLLTIKNLNRHKFRPIVCYLYGERLEKEIENLGVKVINLKMKNKFDISVLFKLYSLIKKGRFNIIHTHLFHANIIGRIMARLLNVPVIISTQHYSFAYNGKLGMFLEKITAPLADRIIAVSEAAKRYCTDEEGILPEKLQLIYNGVDLSMKDRINGKSDLRTQFSLNNNFVIGNIGRFAEVKGHRYLLMAVAEIIKKISNIKLVFVGYGPLKRKIIRLTNALDISKNVILIDSRRDIPQILDLFDLYVLPSLQEGLSITLLEALAMGKPSIATAVGGNPEVIINGESGILIQPKDHQALAEAIINLLNDREKANALGLNGRLRVKERFDIKRTVSETESLYEHLMKNCKKQ